MGVKTVPVIEQKAIGWFVAKQSKRWLLPFVLLNEMVVETH